MGNYISGAELLKKWDMQDFELFEYVQKGQLTPHNEFGEAITCPGYMTRAQLESAKAEYAQVKAKHDEAALKVTDLQNENKKMEAFFALTGNLANVMDISKLDYSIRVAESLSQRFNGWGSGLPSDKKRAKEILELVSTSLYLKDEVSALEASNSKIETNEWEKNIHRLVAIGNEAESIYKIVVSEAGVTDKAINSRSKRRDTALRYFEKHKDDYETLTADHLKDLNLYDFKSSQSKRDFMRRIYTAVLQEIYPHERVSGGKAYDAYRIFTSTKRPN